MLWIGSVSGNPLDIERDRCYPIRMRLGKAIAIAATVHQYQQDKAGEDYILHCLAVMNMVAPDKDAMVVAVLHDVLEDTTYTGLRLAELTDEIRKVFGPTVNDALDCLTHRRGESYDDYIERVATNYHARVVKIADLTHNMDPRRIPAEQIVDKDFERWDKYRRALIRLTREN